MGDPPTGAGKYQHLAPGPSPTYAGHTTVWFDKYCIDPPAFLYLMRDDRLFLTTIYGAGTDAYVISGRLLLPNGEIMAFTFTYTPTVSVTANTQYWDLAEGFLLDLNVTLSSGVTLPGAAFCQAGIARGTGISSYKVATLISGYVTMGQSLGWPFGTMKASTDGAGQIGSFGQAAPAAGAEIVYVQATQTRFKVRMVGFSLVTSSTVATRGVRLVIDDGTHIIAQIPANATQAASLTYVYNGGAFPTNPAAIAGEYFIPLPPDLIIGSGHRLRTLTNNLQATDQYSALYMLGEQWIDY
jgi:hypothetical protein